MNECGLKDRLFIDKKRLASIHHRPGEAVTSGTATKTWPLLITQNDLHLSEKSDQCDEISVSVDVFESEREQLPVLATKTYLQRAAIVEEDECNLINKDDFEEREQSQSTINLFIVHKFMEKTLSRFPF